MERNGQPMEWVRHDPRRRAYNGEELWAIRAANGVGRRRTGAHFYDKPVRAWVARCWQVTEMFNKWRAARDAKPDQRSP